MYLLLYSIHFACGSCKVVCISMHMKVQSSPFLPVNNIYMHISKVINRVSWCSVWVALLATSFQENRWVARGEFEYSRTAHNGGRLQHHRKMFTWGRARLRTTTGSGRQAVWTGRGRLPSQVEPEVAQDPSTGQKSAAHTCHQLPVVQVPSAVGMWHVISLFDELTVHFITKGL